MKNVEWNGCSVPVMHAECTPVDYYPNSSSQEEIAEICIWEVYFERIKVQVILLPGGHSDEPPIKIDADFPGPYSRNRLDDITAHFSGGLTHKCDITVSPMSPEDMALVVEQRRLRAELDTAATDDAEFERRKNVDAEQCYETARWVLDRELRRVSDKNLPSNKPYELDGTKCFAIEWMIDNKIVGPENKMEGSEILHKVREKYDKAAHDAAGKEIGKSVVVAKVHNLKSVMRMKDPDVAAMLKKNVGRKKNADVGKALKASSVRIKPCPRFVGNSPDSLLVEYPGSFFSLGVLVGPHGRST
jgi:hypothetical protein